MKTIAFFNNKGGVGKTSLVYHLAWLYADRGIKVLVADLDPQASLSAMFLQEERSVQLWDDGGQSTVIDCLQPLIDLTGDIATPYVEHVTPRIGLVAGNLALSRFEDLLSESWAKCLVGDVVAFRITTAFHRIMRQAAESVQAELILIDTAPSLGAINRAALIAAEQVVLPLAPDLLSLQGLRNLGPTLREWQTAWQKRLGTLPANSGIDAPAGDMQPLGYVIAQPSVRDSRSLKVYRHWVDRIPGVYRESVVGEVVAEPPSVEADPFCLSLLKHYRSLMPLAMDAHKPMFFLKPADGAVGAHVEAVKACYEDFLTLGRRIGDRAGFAVN